jgi:hypothetical protein
MRLFRTVILITLLLSAVAFAEEVTFNTATTLGCFATSSCTPSSGSATWNPSGSDNTITFTGNGTGDLTTSGGSLNINLGSFSWGGSAYNIDSSEEFFGTVVFSLPTGIVGGQSETFHADIDGTVRQGSDRLEFDFDHNSSNPLVLSFSNGSATGSFNFYVDDVTMNGQGSATWYGHVANASQTPAATPEPGSIVLMGSGLLTLAGAVRRKLRR